MGLSDEEISKVLKIVDKVYKSVSIHSEAVKSNKSYIS
jgi:hypothetical protein